MDTRKFSMDTWFSKKKEGNSRWIQENSRWIHGLRKKEKETPDGYMEILDGCLVLEIKNRKLQINTDLFSIDTSFFKIKNRNA